MTTRPRHLSVVPAEPGDEPGAEPDGTAPNGTDPPDRAELAAAAAAHRFYDKVLGPEGTDPDQTGDPLLVPHFRGRDGKPADRARLERELASVLAAAIGDELDGAVTRLGEHLAEVLAGLRMIDLSDQ